MTCHTLKLYGHLTYSDKRSIDEVFLDEVCPEGERLHQQSLETGNLVHKLRELEHNGIKGAWHHVGGIIEGCGLLGLETWQRGSHR